MFGLNLDHHTCMNISVLHYLTELVEANLAIIVLQQKRTFLILIIIISAARNSPCRRE